MVDFAQTKSFAADPLVVDHGDGLSDILTGIGHGNDAVNGAMFNQARKRYGTRLRASAWSLAVAPPLAITKDDLDEIVDILDASLLAVEESLLATAARPNHERPLARATA
jgi:adenosylmethionine-8-amino-7-oxononanoate aminotransferase